MKKLIGIKVTVAALAAIMCLCLIFSPTAVHAQVQEGEVAYVTFDPYSAIANLDGLEGKDAKQEYRLDRTLDVAYGKVYKLNQISNGCDVFGSELSVSVDKDGKVLSVLGDYLPIPELHENLTMNEAVSVVTQLHSEAKILSVEKKVYAYNHAPELSYDIIVSANGGFRYFVSAKSGEVLLSCPANLNELTTKQVDYYGNEVDVTVEFVESDNKYWLADDLRNIFVVNAKQQQQLGGENYRIDSLDEAFEPIAITAYNNVVKAYDFYTDANNIGISLHGINGKNDDIKDNAAQNGEIPIFVVMHYGEKEQNLFAQYDDYSRQAFICIGDGKETGTMYDTGRALDIIGHEYQHTITQLLCNFVYQGEPGALNEAISDIFGMLIEGYDMTDDNFWNIGEDIAPAGKEPLRSVKAKLPIDSYDQRYTMDTKFECQSKHEHTSNAFNCDRNGVHKNSTIISHIQYLLWEKMPQYFTKERIGTLWYSTLCNLTSTSTFEDFAFTFLQTAINLGFSNEAISTISSTLSDGKFFPNDAHKVTFTYEDGSIMAETWVRNGDKVVYPSNPQKESSAQYEYEFAGWDDAPAEVTEDITIKANFNTVVRSYTVTLVNGDKTYSTQSIKYGDSIDLPTLSASDSPEPGKSFAGWYYDAECTVKAQNSVKISGEVSFYAKWESKKSGCGTIVLGGGVGGTGLMLLSLMTLLCLTVILTNKKKVTE